MTNQEIQKLNRELENCYPDGGYVSRGTIWRHALEDNLVTKEQLEEARNFYGSLWLYTGD